MEPQICCVASNIFGFTGGIQIYTRHLLETLKTLRPNTHYTTLLKYDRTADVVQTTQPISDVEFVCFGRWPRWLQTVAMTLTILWLALRHRGMLFITTHANYAKALYLAKRLFGSRYWVVAHGLEVWNVEPGWLQQALRHADAIAAVSHYTRQRLLKEQALSPQQIGVLPNTFDPSRFQIQPKPAYLLERHGLTPEQPVILTVCRLGKSETYKGYDLILRRLPQIRQQLPTVHYVLVGKGDDTPRIQQLIRELKLEEHVTLTGFVADEELPAYYSLCDVFAMPSTGEGFGIVYLEALACGKPVLAGNQDGAVDPLLSGELGCLVNPHDPDEIADRLVQILQGQYSNLNLYRPQVLRQSAIAHFATPQFQAHLHTLLQRYGHLKLDPLKAAESSV